MQTDSPHAHGRNGTSHPLSSRSRLEPIVESRPLQTYRSHSTPQNSSGDTRFSASPARPDWAVFHAHGRFIGGGSHAAHSGAHTLFGPYQAWASSCRRRVLGAFGLPQRRISGAAPSPHSLSLSPTPFPCLDSLPALPYASLRAAASRSSFCSHTSREGVLSRTRRKGELVVEIVEEARDVDEGVVMRLLVL